MLATHVPLGMQVLDRGIVFIDLAIAQIAGLRRDRRRCARHARGRHCGADRGGVRGAARRLLLTWTERRAPQQQEALIGVMFILAACAGILLLSSNPHGGEHLKDLLVGQILWVNATQLLWLARRLGRAAGALAGWVERLGRFGFYGAFALAVTASVQLVGVYLVFSSLIIPALGTRAHGRARRLASPTGSVPRATLLGLALSALFDLPSGAVIVWTLAACGFAWRAIAEASAARAMRAAAEVRPR